MADIYCDQETPDYVQFECGSELGGIVGVGLIAPDQSPSEVNLEDEAWWTNGVSSSPQIAWIIKDTRGTLAAGTPTEEEGFGLVPTQRTGDDRELTFEVQGVADNRDFWASVNKRTNWKLVYITASGTGFYVENVSLYGSEMIEQSIKTRMRWSVSAKWSTDMTPALPFEAPEDLFTS